jgi:hypothetical protein
VGDTEPISADLREAFDQAVNALIAWDGVGEEPTVSVHGRPTRISVIASLIETYKDPDKPTALPGCPLAPLSKEGAMTERDLTEREDRLIVFWLTAMAVVLVFVFILSTPTRFSGLEVGLPRLARLPVRRGVRSCQLAQPWPAWNRDQSSRLRTGGPSRRAFANSGRCSYKDPAQLFRGIVTTPPRSGERLFESHAPRPHSHRWLR